MLLLSVGASMMVRTVDLGMFSVIIVPSGSTPLHMAAQKGHVAIIQALLQVWKPRTSQPLWSSSSFTASNPHPLVAYPGHTADFEPMSPLGPYPGHTGWNRSWGNLYDHI